jgi:membrane-associated phospholipid phosphatase
LTDLTLVGIVAITVSLLIGVLAKRGLLAGIDDRLMRAGAMVPDVTPAWVISMWKALTHLGDPAVRTVVAIIAFAVIIGRRTTAYGAMYLLVVTAGVLGYTGLKHLYARPRPLLTTWLTSPTDPSYPSGHAAGAMLVLLLAAMLLGGRGLVCAAVVLALLIGLSRIAMGVHWPSDVLGGWLFGSGVAMVGYGILMRFGGVIPPVISGV